MRLFRLLTCTAAALAALSARGGGARRDEPASSVDVTVLKAGVLSDVQAGKLDSVKLAELERFDVKLIQQRFAQHDLHGVRFPDEGTHPGDPFLLQPAAKACASQGSCQQRVSNTCHSLGSQQSGSVNVEQNGICGDGTNSGSCSGSCANGVGVSIVCECSGSSLMP